MNWGTSGRGAITFTKLGVQFLGLGYYYLYLSTEKNKQVYPVWCSRLYNHLSKNYVKCWGSVQFLGRSGPSRPPVVAILSFNISFQGFLRGEEYISDINSIICSCFDLQIQIHHRNDVRYVLLTPQNPRNDILKDGIGQISKKRNLRWLTATMLDFCSPRS